MSEFNPLIRGIIQVTGEPDVGKTTFALECGADPSRICFFDADVKGRATVDQLLSSGIRFGIYHDLNTLAEGRREVEFFLAVKGLIDAIKPDQYDAIIFDTWGRFGKCFHPYVLANPSEFKLKWSPSGRIKGAEQWQEAQQYEARILNHLGTLSPVVIIVSHLKDHYLNSAKTGKQVPASSRTFDRVPRFRIWLRHNPSSPVPIGLVLKRIDKKEYVQGVGLRTVSVLPRKIVPKEGERSLWDSIARYFKAPVGTREPTEDEMPNDFEMSILDGTLTKEQRYTLELMLKAGAVETAEEEPIEGMEEESDANILYVERMREEGASESYIAHSLKEQGLSYPEIKSAMGLESVPEASRLVREGANESQTG